MIINSVPNMRQVSLKEKGRHCYSPAGRSILGKILLKVMDVGMGQLLKTEGIIE